MTALARLVTPPEPQAATFAEFAADVIEGLKATPKRLSPKYFYDETGSRLFERITMQPEYYPTRLELGILRTHASDIAQLLPARGALIEFGSGSSKKARLILRASPHLSAYAPVDISAEFLQEEARGLRIDFPALTIAPVEADFLRPFALPTSVAALPRAGFFPGSTIGNFEPHQACTFLRHAGAMLGRRAVLVIGVDRVKDRGVLNAAYNDAEGVTKQFNLNILARINRELGGNFDLATFEHHAFFNRELSRVEMHLASVKRQKVRIGSDVIEFRAGETIHTESSYKYTMESFGALARGSGWAPLARWTDEQGYFAVHALSFKGEEAKPAQDAFVR
jgi:dimethylhistidine N-methyltransferase